MAMQDGDTHNSTAGPTRSTTDSSNRARTGHPRLGHLTSSQDGDKIVGGYKLIVVARQIVGLWRTWSSAKNTTKLSNS